MPEALPNGVKLPQKGVEIMKCRLRTKVGAGLLSLALLIPLNGCQQAEQTTQHAVPPSENIGLQSSWTSSADGKGFYFYDKYTVLSYCDPAAQRQVPVCENIDCKHRDNSCTARLVDTPSLLASYGGDLYVASTEEKNHAVLWKIDLESLQLTQVCDLAPELRRDTYYFSEGIMAHGYAYLNLTRQLAWQGNTVDAPVLVQVNLEDGTTQTLFDGVPFLFLGAGEDRVLVAVDTYDVPPLSQEEYLQQEPNGNYYAYLNTYLSQHDSGISEIRAYTPDMTNYQLVTQGTPWYSSMPSLTRYGDTILYAIDHVLYCYDLASGESRTVVEDETLLDYFMVDGQIVYTLGKSTSSARTYYTPLGGGSVHEMALDEKGRSISFQPQRESQDYLYGLYTSPYGPQDGLLSKEDYFAGRHENVVPCSETEGT